MDALEASAVDAGLVASVADAIGMLQASSLDVLIQQGLPAMKVAGIKKALGAASSGLTTAAAAGVSAA